MTGFHWTTVTALLAMMAVGISAIPDMDCPPTDEDIVLYPNPEDCSTFYQCSYGRPVLHKCPPGLHYNAKAQYCDYPESAGCQTFLKYAVPDYKCPANDNGGSLILYPDPEDCTKYYICDNGALVSMNCPPGLHFNSKKKVCDHPNAAGCKSNFRSNIHRLGEFECPITDDGANITFHPNPNDCNEYFACDNNVLTPLKCPPGLHFNPTLHVCDFPNAAGCQKTPSIYKDLPTFRDFECPDADDGANITFHANPKNCSQYFACDNGVLTRLECPGELHFNPILNVCDFPDVAGCVEEPEEVPFNFFESRSVSGLECPDEDDGINIISGPDPENCEKYYVCDNGVETSLDCPPGLHFNPKLKVCDHPQAAGCKAAFRRRKERKALLRFIQRAQ